MMIRISCMPQRCVKHVKSNAITIAKDGRLLGMGSGQPNRVNSVRIAVEKSAKEVQVRGTTACSFLFLYRDTYFITRPPIMSYLTSCCCPHTHTRTHTHTHAQGSVLASDAFFPFSWGDSVEIACQAGVKAIVHPGGSLKDQVGWLGASLNSPPQGERERRNRMCISVHASWPR